MTEDDKKPPLIPTLIEMTPERISEIEQVIKDLKGKQLEKGKLVDLNPNGSTAWYIAYST